MDNHLKIITNITQIQYKYTNYKHTLEELYQMVWWTSRVAPRCQSWTDCMVIWEHFKKSDKLVLSKIQ